MKFSELKYRRPDYEKIREQLSGLLTELENASDPKQFVDILKETDRIRSNIFTMSSLASIRHTINTADEFYDKENDYWDEYGPLYSVLDTRLAHILVNCPFREELYETVPKVLFQLAECQIRSFSEEVIELLQTENRLSSEYGKLKASARIEYNGEILNLSTIAPYTESTDESVRKSAWDAKMKFYSDHEADFDRIYDEMVKVRTEIAHKLGFSSFTELAYLRMNRIDYDAAMVAEYRRQILNDIVPLATSLYEKQAARLNVPTISYYNENMEFPDGNPTPKGSYDELIEAARKMYTEMSPETAEFINTMIEGELWDLKSREGKAMGGYCTSLPDYHVPFIFANFNGTSGDVDVLTHEAGHAFQYYCSRNIPFTELQWPNMESAEIDSMTMEFNAYPWISLFFKEDAARYKFTHLSGTVKFLPYGVLVDHFQHEIYDHPQWNPEERKACWRRLERQYLPHKDYTGCDLLEKGCWWYQQGHIFESPFYYIDYTLAQVCALQFWRRNYHNDPDSWKDYLHLCSLGGTLAFTGLVREANLEVPFQPGCLKGLAEDLEKWFDSVNDREL